MRGTRAAGLRCAASKAGALVTAAVLVLMACTSESSGGGVSGYDAGATEWRSGPCHACVAGACQSEIDQCATDPTCAAYYDCLGDCPTGSDGNVASSCEASCPKPSGSAGGQTIADLDACRNGGAGAQCTACGGGGDAGSEGGACTDTPLLCQQCDPVQDENPCATCELSKCCDSYADCKGDPLCDAYALCMREDCPLSYNYKQCVEFCDAAHPGGFLPLSTRLACVSNLCYAECAPSPCTDCLAEHCAIEDVACKTNEDCARLSLCTQDCDSDSCFDACLSQWPGGRADYEAWGDCGVRNCTDLCG